jgi:hypothetical protein
MRIWCTLICALVMTGASWMAPGSAVADDETPTEADEEARKHFKAGVAFLQDPEGERFEEAYAQFKRAYELSKSPKVLGNMGLCAMKLERDGEAIDAYTRYLRDVSDIDPEERAQIERDLETLKASVVTVEIDVELRGKQRLEDVTIHDERITSQGKIRNVYAPQGRATTISIRPGRHVIDVKLQGADRGRWEFEAVPGARLEHAFVIKEAPVTTPQPTPTPLPQPAGRSSTWYSYAGPAVMIGLGAGALIAGGVLGIVTLGKVSDLDEKCPNKVCPADSFEDDVESVRSFVQATDFLLLGGGIVALAGVAWAIGVASTEGDSTEGDQAKAPVAAGAACDAHGCAGVVRLSF